MWKVVARYGPGMSEERRERIVAAIEQSGASPSGWSDVDWGSNEDGTETELMVLFTHVEPENRVHDRDRADRLAAELRCCGMISTVEEYGEAIE
jgi:hypothetical protein